MKQIERQVIRKRAALIRKGRYVFASAIRDQYQAVIKALSMYTPGQVKEHLPFLVKEEPIQQAFEKMYVQAADIAMMWRKNLIPPKKDGVEDVYKMHFVANLKTFARHKTASRVTGITETTRERIAQAIDYAMEEGIGVPSMTDLIIENVARDYKEITVARSQMIAQTEMITASNEASMEAGRSTGLETHKFWSTSGLGNVRDSHMEAEQDSNDVGGYADGELFSNGLLYPGDPNGPPEEVINCHCCLLLEIV
jgi:hypothetical protein